MDGGDAGGAQRVDDDLVDVERLAGERRSSQRLAVVEDVDLVRACANGGPQIVKKE